MAIRTIYSGEHRGKRIENLWRVEIIDVDNINTNPPDELPPLTNGVRLTYGSDREINEPLVPSEVEFTVAATSAFFTWAIGTLAVTQEGRFYIKVYKNNNIWWRGAILTDRIEWTDSGEPTLITIRAHCGLGRLQKMKIKDNEPTLPINLLRNIHRLLKFAGGEPLLYEDGERFISTNFVWYEDKMPITVGSGDALRYISYHPEGVHYVVDQTTGERRFESYYDLLSLVCRNFGINVAMSNGNWQVWQYPELIGTGAEVRYYSYNAIFEQGINPSVGSVTVIDNYINKNVKKEIRPKEVGDGYLTPITSANNRYRPSIWLAFTTSVFDPALLIFSRNNANLTAGVIVPYSFHIDFGFTIQGLHRVEIDGTSLSSPLFIRVEITHTVTVTDGVTTYYLTPSMQWVTAVTTLNALFNIEPLPNGQKVWHDLAFLYQTQQLPLAGTVSVNFVTAAIQVPALINQNTLIGAVISTMQIAYYSISGQFSARQTAAIENNAVGQNSTIELDIGKTSIIDRDPNYIQYAAKVWNGTTAVNSLDWRVRDTGTARTLINTLLHHVMFARQTPQPIIEGAFIGQMPPNFKAVTTGGTVFIHVSSVFNTDLETSERVQLQRLPSFEFTVSPTLSVDVIGTVASGVYGGLNATNTTPTVSTTLSDNMNGATLAGLSPGTATEITLNDPLLFGLSTGQRISIVDPTTNGVFTFEVGEPAAAGDTTIQVVSQSVPMGISAGAFLIQNLPSLIAASQDAHYRHVQSVELTEWPIEHNLGKQPSVQAFDTGGTQIIGQVTHINNNELKITFAYGLTGTAYLN